MERAVILYATLFFSPMAVGQGQWLSPEDINKANQRIESSFTKSKAAENQGNAATGKVIQKNVVTYVPTARDIQRQAAEAEAERARAIETAIREAKFQEEQRTMRAEQQERIRQHQEQARQEKEYQLRSAELRQRQIEADQQEARLRLLEQQAAQAHRQNNQPAKPMDCFSFGGGFMTCE